MIALGDLVVVIFLAAVGLWVYKKLTHSPTFNQQVEELKEAPSADVAGEVTASHKRAVARTETLRRKREQAALEAEIIQQSLKG